MSPVTVLIVEDFEPMRRLIRSMMEQTGFQVAGEASDGPEAVQKAQAVQPDLIVLDIGLPTLSGITAAKEMRKLAPGSKILFLSQESSRDFAKEALDAGGLAYVLKAQMQRELQSAIEIVLGGKQFIGSGLSLPTDKSAPAIGALYRSNGV